MEPCSPDGCHYYSGPGAVGYCARMRVTLKSEEDREFWARRCCENMEVS